MLHSGLGRKHFVLDKQVAMIQGHGAQCVIFPVLQCPCLLDDRQFSPTCSTCHGTGRFYPPNSSFATMLLMHEEDSMRAFHEAGTWMDGTIRASVLPGVRLCERDKVIMVDIKDTYADEVLTQGLDDRLRFDQGAHLLLVADRQRVYRPGVDYILSPPATVTWLPSGLSPGLGQQYSVKYEAYPLFLVVNDSPRLRVEHRIPQSQEVVLMRWDRVSEDF
jgi:hypothetical protein